MDKSGATPSERAISVLLIDDEEMWVRTQRRLLERVTDRVHVSTATSFEAATDTLRRETPDCIVCDYQLGDGTGLELLARVRATDPELPFILVTGEGDEGVASDAISEQVTDYIRKMHLSQQPTRLAQRIESVVAADRTRRALARERQRKEALLEMVTGSTTRSELGRNICTHLVDEGYACTWIAVLDNDRGVIPLATAGETDYLEAALTPGTRPADSTEPTFLAFDTSEPVVYSPTETDERAETAEWEAIAVDHGFRSVAALPISHNDVHFGVLTVYGQTPQIDDRERALLTEYAETVGYAFQTTAWKRTLLSSATATVEFTLSGHCHPLVAFVGALPDKTTLRAATVIPRNDREVLYVTAIDGITESELSAAENAAESVLSVEQYRTDDELRCGLVAESPAPEMRLADAGVSISETIIEEGRARISAVIGAETTVQACVDVLSELCGDGSVTTLWTATEQSVAPRAGAVDELTERQRQVLELAIEAGYFERPRHNNTGELADALDISRATFTQHLRAAQRKLFAAEIHR